MDTLTLRPDRAATARWSALSVVLVAIGIWLVGDANGEPVTGPAMWAVFGLIVFVAAWFILQLLAPTWFELHVEADGIRGRTLWQHLDVPWDRVESAGIRVLAGESYLRLRVIDEVPGGWVVRNTNVVLPLGADITALRMALARARALGRSVVESPAQMA